MKRRHQLTLDSFHNDKNRGGRKTSSWTSRSGVNTTPRQGGHTSKFGECPLCGSSFPVYRLEAHASCCNGKKEATKPKYGISVPLEDGKSERDLAKNSTAERDFGSVIQHTSEPLPGLFLYENFITPEEEESILLDIKADNVTNPFKSARFNGFHIGKRWGVHCNLRDRRVGAAENPLPETVREILFPKMLNLPPMIGCVPNEANAIDYRRNRGHWLQAHVDDRRLSKEPIANLSLAGDCYMTFRNERKDNRPIRVLLPRRCLQILTKSARYDCSHAISNEDLLSDRRVSITMRESPLTEISAQRPLGKSIAEMFKK